MATCKGCVHYKLCGVFGYVFPVESCGLYTDRSRFVELPCKIGDTVYASWDMCKSFSAPREIKGFVVDLILISDKTYIGFRAGRKDEKDGCLYDIEFDLRDIGKTVFLTREEAEQALKERKEND